MIAEVVTVGSELLLGTSGNGNLRTICRALEAIGVEVAFATSVRDDERDITDVIAGAARRTDAVIITGGLGPTHDDLTREALAAVTGRPLEYQASLEEDLREFFRVRERPMSELNLRQAYLPAGSTAISNRIGTAPGISLEHAGVPIFALPGVPAEMLAMLEGRVLPALAERSGGSLFATRIVRTVGRGESEVAAMIAPVIEECRRATTPVVTLLASRGEVSIHLRAGGGGADEAEARIAPVEQRLREILGDLVFGFDADTLESVVVGMALERSLTLALAESFTGGGLASRLVAVPGVSAVLRAGYVTYAVESKVRDLGVPAGVLEKFGPVSEPVARAMAEGARTRAMADVALSTTGEAGPEPSSASVGTMYVGLAHSKGSLARRLVVSGGRQGIRDWGAQTALDTLRRWLLEEGGG